MSWLKMKKKSEVIVVVLKNKFRSVSKLIKQ